MKEAAEGQKWTSVKSGYKGSKRNGIIFISMFQHSNWPIYIYSRCLMDEWLAARMNR